MNRQETLVPDAPDPASSRMQSINLTVPGMGSDHCAGLVSSSIKRLQGILAVLTNIANHRVTVRFDPALAQPAQIRPAVERAGYDVDAFEDERTDSGAQETESEERYLALARKRLWIAAIPATLIMLLMVPHMFCNR